MSRIQELIKELCPKGVEYKKLEEICTFKRGQSITMKQLSEGHYPVVAGGQQPAFYCNQYNRDGEYITISGSGAYAGYVNYWNEKILCTDCFSLHSKDLNKLNNKFLYHYLKSNQNNIYNSKKEQEYLMFIYQI